MLIALGTLVLSSGGLVQGAVGHDEAFTATLAIGITVIYSGFLLAATRGGDARVLQATLQGKISPRVVDFAQAQRAGGRSAQRERPPGGSSNGSGTRVRAA